mmetsp:Transcript_23437/g.73382  ORF Transcript_23437/g.73382 Transcript_23437/m.73382 type:complete len:514 (-) Transcript_23437:240-1781(-)
MWWCNKVLAGSLLAQGALAASVWDEVAVIEGRIYEPTFREATYAVKDFGAVGDGETDDLGAVTAAITAANLAGGGTVETTAGATYYLDGPLELLSNVRLKVGEGTKLVWSSRSTSYLPAVLTKFEGTEVFNYSPLLRAYLASNVSIVGAGPSSVLDGSGDEWFEKDDDDADRLREMGNDSVPVYSRVFGSSAALPPNFIEPFGADTVHLENLTIRNSPFWTVHPVASQNVICRGLSINTSNTKNSDGIDPEGSVDVLIEHVDFDTGDDCVAIKAGRDADGWRLARSTRNVIVRRSRLSSKCNALCIGSEVSGGVSDVYFYDNVIDSASVALYFKSNLDRGSFVRNVRVFDVSATRVDTCLEFTNDYHGSRGGFFPTDFDSFSLHNISCSLSSPSVSAPDGGLTAISAKGVDNDHPIANVIVANLSVVTTSAAADDDDDDDDADVSIDIEHVSNFDLVNVFVDGVRVDQNYTDVAPSLKNPLDDPFLLRRTSEMLRLIMHDDDALLDPPVRPSD